MRWLILTMLAIVTLCGCPAPKGDSGGETAPLTSGSSGSQTADAKVAPPVTVWADPLLEPLLDGLADGFQAVYPGGYTVEYLDRGVLIGRFAEGVPDSLPGVFLFTGDDLLTFLVADGVVNETTSRIFAGDRLALVQQAGEGYATPTLFDIYTLRFKSFAIGGDNTTAGYFADQSLFAEGVRSRIEDRLTAYDSLTALIAAITTGESPLGIVPVSAIGEEPGIEVVMIIGEDLHEDIQFRAAASTSDAPGTLDLLVFLSENEEIQKIIPGYGYVDLETALIED